MKHFEMKYYRTVTSELIAEWDEAWNQSENATVFNSYWWFELCLRAEKITNFEIAVCYRRGELVAIVPLLKSRCYGVPVMTTLGYKYCVDTPFLLVDTSTEVVEFFFTALLAKYALYLTTIDESIATVLKTSFPTLFLSLMSVNPYIQLGEGDPLRYVSSSNKRSIRKVLRAHGSDFTFQEHTADTSDLGAEFEKLVSIEQHSSKKANHKDIFSDTHTLSFYKHMVKYGKQFVRIYVLLYKETPIVYGLCLTDGKKMIGYQTSYLLEYRSLSPGKILLQNVLNDLNESFEIFDFGGGISTYKQEYTPNYFFQYNLYYSNNIFIVLWWKSINWARRMKQTYFPLKYTRDHEFLFKTIEQATSQLRHTYVR